MLDDDASRGRVLSRREILKLTTASGALLLPGWSFVRSDTPARPDEVHSHPPYAARGRRRRRNADDGIFRNGGSRLLLEIDRAQEGYAAAFDVALAATLGSEEKP